MHYFRNSAILALVAAALTANAEVSLEQINNAKVAITYTAFRDLQCNAPLDGQNVVTTQLDPVTANGGASCQLLTAGNPALTSLSANMTTSDPDVVLYGCAISFWGADTCSGQRFAQYHDYVAPGACIPNITFGNSRVWVSAECDKVAVGDENLKYPTAPINPGRPPRVVPAPRNVTMDAPTGDPQDGSQRPDAAGLSQLGVSAPSRRAVGRRAIGRRALRGPVF